MKKLFPYVHSCTKFIGLNNLIYKSPVAMHHIIDNLYLGDFRAADDPELLRKNKITHIINCAFNCPNKYPNQFTYLSLNLVDEPNQKIITQMKEAYEFIKQNSNTNIFVHCVFGKSRSASVIIYYMMKEKGMDYDAALNYVKKIRAIADPNPGFAEQLREASKV